jgi:hypothetical protein
MILPNHRHRWMTIQMMMLLMMLGVKRTIAMLWPALLDVSALITRNKLIGGV